jgi:hypothetical protein
MLHQRRSGCVAFHNVGFVCSILERRIRDTLSVDIDTSEILSLECDVARLGLRPYARLRKFGSIKNDNRKEGRSRRDDEDRCCFLS